MAQFLHNLTQFVNRASCFVNRNNKRLTINDPRSTIKHFSRFFSKIIIFIIIFSLIIPPSTVRAQAMLPIPGVMVEPTPAFVPSLLKGMTVHPEDPLKFDFIIDNGNSGLENDELKKESNRLIKYFLASLTVPKDELWVNLSPNEKDRIIPDALGRTDLGRDLLAQDYILKQLTASLMYPEDELGKKFWDKVYKEAYEKYGTTDIPVDTFNKVWIMPESASVYENGNTVFIVDSKLKVLLEQDYLSLERLKATTTSEKKDALATEIIREIIIPAITKEVNEGANFALLRQIYNSLILAKWYKDTIKNSILSNVYVDKNKTAGINNDDPKMKEKIYEQYMQAYKKGVYNYIKDEYDPSTKDIIPRKYFSGGFKGQLAKIKHVSNAMMTVDQAMGVGKLDKVEVILDTQKGSKRTQTIGMGVNFDKEKEAIINNVMERYEEMIPPELKMPQGDGTHIYGGTFFGSIKNAIRDFVKNKKMEANNIFLDPFAGIGRMGAYALAFTNVGKVVLIDNNPIIADIGERAFQELADRGIIDLSKVEWIVDDWQEHTSEVKEADAIYLLPSMQGVAFDRTDDFYDITYETTCICSGATLDGDVTVGFGKRPAGQKYINAKLLKEYMGEKSLTLPLAEEIVGQLVRIAEKKDLQMLGKFTNIISESPMFWHVFAIVWTRISKDENSINSLKEIYRMLYEKRDQVLKGQGSSIQDQYSQINKVSKGIKPLPKDFAMGIGTPIYDSVLSMRNVNASKAAVKRIADDKAMIGEEAFFFGPALGLGIGAAIQSWIYLSNANWIPYTLSWARRVVINLDDNRDDIVMAIKKIAKSSDDPEGDIFLLQRLISKYDSYGKEEILPAAHDSIIVLKRKDVINKKTESIKIQPDFAMNASEIIRYDEIDYEKLHKPILVGMNFDVVKNNKIKDPDKVVKGINGIKDIEAPMVFVTHNGRPLTDGAEGLGLEPLVGLLQKLMPNKNVRLASGLTGPGVALEIKNLKKNDVLLLTNFRGDTRAESPSKEEREDLVKDIVFENGDISKPMFSLFISNAFASAPRLTGKSPSTSLIDFPKFLPSVIGPLMMEEIDRLEPAREISQYPFVALQKVAARTWKELNYAIKQEARDKRRPIEGPAMNTEALLSDLTTQRNIISGIAEGYEALAMLRDMSEGRITAFIKSLEEKGVAVYRGNEIILEEKDLGPLFSNGDFPKNIIARMRGKKITPIFLFYRKGFNQYLEAYPYKPKGESVWGILEKVKMQALKGQRYISAASEPVYIPSSSEIAQEQAIYIFRHYSDRAMTSALGLFKRAQSFLKSVRKLKQGTDEWWEKVLKDTFNNREEIYYYLSKAYKNKEISDVDKERMRAVIGTDKMIDDWLKERGIFNRAEMVEAYFYVVREGLSVRSMYSANRLREIGYLRLKTLGYDDLKDVNMTLIVSADKKIRDFAAKFLSENDRIEAYARAILNSTDFRTIMFSLSQLLKIKEAAKRVSRITNIALDFFPYIESILNAAEELRKEKGLGPLDVNADDLVLARAYNILKSLQSVPKKRLKLFFENAYFPFSLIEQRKKINELVINKEYKLERKTQLSKEALKAVFNLEKHKMFETPKVPEIAVKNKIIIIARDSKKRIIGYIYGGFIGNSLNNDNDRIFHEVSNIVMPSDTERGVDLALRIKLMEAAKAEGFKYYAFYQAKSELGEDKLDSVMKKFYGQKGLYSSEYIPSPQGRSEKLRYLVVELKVDKAMNTADIKQIVTNVSAARDKLIQEKGLESGLIIGKNPEAIKGRQPILGLIKPEASKNNVAIMLAWRYFLDLGYGVQNVRIYRAGALRNKLMQHYKIMAKASTEGRKFLDTDLVAKKEFLNFFNLLENNYENLKIFGGQELVDSSSDKVGMTQKVTSLWNDSMNDEARFKKLKSEFYISKVKMDGEDVYLINGNTPSQMYHFTNDDAITISFELVPVRDNAVSLSVLRDKLGSTDMRNADKGTLRGIFYLIRDELGIKEIQAEMPKMINVVHLSSSYLEAVREAIIWGGNLEDQPLAQQIKNTGVTTYGVIKILLDEKPKELFDAVEKGDISEKDVVAMARDYLLHGVLDKAMGAEENPVSSPRYTNGEAPGGIDIARKDDLNARGINSSLKKDVGGIDLNNIEVDREGTGAKIEFDSKALRNTMDNSMITGFAPVIINITPINNILPLLGLSTEDDSDSPNKISKKVELVSKKPDNKV